MSSTFNCSVARRCVVSAVLLFGLAASAHGQTVTGASRAARVTPDLSGVWDAPGLAEHPIAGGYSGHGAEFISREEPSMTPWAMEKFKNNRRALTDPTAAGNPAIDPYHFCYPLGPSRSLSGMGNRTFEIRQLPDVMLILFERDHWIRRIYTDGRGHPAGYPITWMGHSIGKWDGDTFVADTVFINPMNWADPIGHPQSDAMHLIERFHRAGQTRSGQTRTGQTLRIETTFDDPKAYTKPWKEIKNFELMPPGYEVVEHVECEDSLGKILRIPEEGN